MSLAHNPVSGDILASANQMPDSDYGFKPADTVRAFAAILAPVAVANYVFCAPALGEKLPHEQDHFEKTATRPASR